MAELLGVVELLDCAVSEPVVPVPVPVRMLLWSELIVLLLGVADELLLLLWSELVELLGVADELLVLGVADELLLELVLGDVEVVELVVGSLVVGWLLVDWLVVGWLVVAFSSELELIVVLVDELLDPAVPESAAGVTVRVR
ncbi:MAG TPA: hypothetical protein VN428_15910 [Bryobacteraceae bacterium]|nr:hypothetical protein [Bryobacteraceae bacterium]